MLLGFLEFSRIFIEYTFCDCCLRAQLAGLLTHYVPNLLDPRGRLLPRSYDALGDALICFNYFYCL